MESSKRFVIQKHIRAGQVHWDLMLEAAGVLETYRLEVSPDKLSLQVNTAIKIFDHPVKFLSFEGSVNKGQGSVEIADSGIYQLLSGDESCKEIEFEGKILKGKFLLKHIEGNQWKFKAEK